MRIVSLTPRVLDDVWADVRRVAVALDALARADELVAAARARLAALAQRDQWRALPAVRGGRVSVVDGSAYFNRPGPRLVESAEILAALVHPEVCTAPVADGILRVVRA